MKLTLELSAEVHRDLTLYAQVLAEAEGQAFTPPQLVGPMLSRFMATDRSFISAKAKR